MAVDYDGEKPAKALRTGNTEPPMIAHQTPVRLLILALTSVVLLSACNQEPGDSAPSEVPASAPMDSSASS